MQKRREKKDLAIGEYIRIFRYIKIMDKIKDRLLNIFLGIVFVGTVLLLITFPVAIIPFWEGCIVFLGIIYIIQFLFSGVLDGVLVLFKIFLGIIQILGRLFGFRK